MFICGYIYEKYNNHLCWKTTYTTNIIYFCKNILVRVKLGYIPNFTSLGHLRVLFHYYSGRPAGRMAGWLEFSENKANSVQIKLNLPVWTELGNNIIIWLCLVNILYYSSSRKTRQLVMTKQKYLTSKLLMWQICMDGNQIKQSYWC